MPNETERKVIGVEVAKMRALLEEEAAKGKTFKCRAVKNHGQIIAWEYDTEDGTILRVGPTLHPWVPHEPLTWPHRYMTSKVPIVMSKWNQRHPVEENTTKETLPIGSRVKIVMASRFGDVGITDDLTAEHGYHARININQLDEKFENFSMDP